MSFNNLLMFAISAVVASKLYYCDTKAGRCHGLGRLFMQNNRALLQSSAAAESIAIGMWW